MKLSGLVWNILVVWIPLLTLRNNERIVPRSSSVSKPSARLYLQEAARHSDSDWRLATYKLGTCNNLGLLFEPLRK